MLKGVQDEARDLSRAVTTLDVEEQLRRVAQLQEQVDGLASGFIGRARHHRVTWVTISAIFKISEDTARHRYTERLILRRLGQFSRRPLPSSLRELFTTKPPVPLHSAEASAAGQTGESALDESIPIREPTGAALNRLAPVLSMLVRTARLSNKEVSDLIGCSGSYLSRILSGERVPTWALTQKIARACGADPEVLRAVWESEKLSSRCRDIHYIDYAGDRGQSAAERLRKAIRTLHLRAGRPQPEDIAVASRWALSFTDADGILKGHNLPTWESLTNFILTLGGKPYQFKEIFNQAEGEIRTEGALPSSASGELPLD
ncbi:MULTISPECIES: helix-turn-helix domain-containing protein [Streptomyces]|uniref:XRE family transcriptional regulator n=1 Tax=Streptomyces tsukubensis (strain DSM 42081 / NBRC 108919 / NRRL 18488 / 9993) TaxID=1114943 RepID=I2N860_STRT9|nr:MULTISPECIES: helix-turn-helix transcriptional regulator [Streptomyces]AZK97109.1 transcriptional regulator [Streptomyces tsukubensis]EIF93207.1 hypothetical protein [Streptomyces tsukubensis NRRL18488]MYS67957.1 helix-turn-helix domain-containing protein [Streptomyces sp. SID5473]QKM66920.1 XRE family transcriptional regulator [Streptomyces tsukubensis NRRL18488]TAI44732.1 XRE family transcriptional regulator [Streptomyces tsukubensis]